MAWHVLTECWSCIWSIRPTRLISMQSTPSWP
jgi:hypothetical protein